MSHNVLAKNINIPIRTTNTPTFDQAYASVMEHFMTEMKHMDAEMTKFSSNLMRMYAQTSTEPSSSDWEVLANSPLVQGEGEIKTLKLQFDVSQFAPDEITVQVLDNILVVSAKHEESSEANSVVREYNREFLLPRGTKPASIVSSLATDGILTIEAPMPKLALKPGTTKETTQPTQQEQPK